MVGLVRALDVEIQVRALLLAENRKVCVEVVEVKTSNFLIEDLGQQVNAQVEGSGLLELGELGAELLVVGVEQRDLGKNLVGERAAHDEARVTSGTAEVH